MVVPYVLAQPAPQAVNLEIDHAPAVLVHDGGQLAAAEDGGGRAPPALGQCRRRDGVGLLASVLRLVCALTYSFRGIFQEQLNELREVLRGKVRVERRAIQCRVGQRVLTVKEVLPVKELLYVKVDVALLSRLFGNDFGQLARTQMSADLLVELGVIRVAF